MIVRVQTIVLSRHRRAQAALRLPPRCKRCGRAIPFASRASDCRKCATPKGGCYAK